MALLPWLLIYTFFGAYVVFRTVRNPKYQLVSRVRVEQWHDKYHGYPGGGRAKVESDSIRHNSKAISSRFFLMLGTWSEREAEGGEDGCCSICMEDLTPETGRQFLNCGHMFHEDCLKKWVRSGGGGRSKLTCPMCRTSVDIPVDNSKL